MFEFLNSVDFIFYMVVSGSFILFAIALLGIIIQKNLIKLFISLSIAEASLFLFFIGTHFSGNKAAPILNGEIREFDPSLMTDPVPQAMILTTIVIAVAVTALALSYAAKYYSLSGNMDINRMDELGDEK